MSETINWTFAFQVQNGPKMTATQTLNVDTYDKSATTIKKGAKVLMEAGDAAEMQFLLLTASVYDPTLTYQIAPDNKQGPEHKLDAPLLLIGSGGLAFLDQQSITVQVTNKSDKDVTIEMLIGRSTTVVENPAPAAAAQGGAPAPAAQPGAGGGAPVHPAPPAAGGGMTPTTGATETPAGTSGAQLGAPQTHTG